MSAGVAHDWDRAWARAGRLEALRDLDRRIYAEIRRVVDPRGLRALELGCGSATLSAWLARDGARSVTLLDASATALELARRALEGVDAARFVLADARAFDEGAPYDLVFSSGLAEHFDGGERAAIVERHARLAGGIALLVVPARPHLNELRHRRARTRALYGWQRAFSRSELTCLLTRETDPELLRARRFAPLYGVSLVDLLASAGNGRISRAWNRLCELGDGLLVRSGTRRALEAMLAPFADRCGGLLLVAVRRRPPRD